MNGMQRNGQHLDFTNPELQQWLKDCPFEITSLQQLLFEPKDKKQVELVVEIPVDQCAVNFQYYGLTLGEKTKELETRYQELDKEWKKLIVAEVKEKNPVEFPNKIFTPEGDITVFDPGFPLYWSVKSK